MSNPSDPQARAAELRAEINERISEYSQLQLGPDQPFALLRPTFAAEDQQAAVEVLLSGQVSMGARVAEFERAWTRWNGSADALMVNSGSSANLLALSAMASEACPHPIRPGDEVIVPAICWSTSVFPILQIGAVPVLADVDPVTLNLSPATIQAALSPKTRGIVVIHVLGNPCPMREIMALAAEHELVVLEDCCEAHGATVGGERVGNFGHLGSFSFFLSHHMTTIEGGMVTMQEPARWRDLLVSRRAHGWIRGRSDEAEWKARYPGLNGGWIFVESGYNLRPTELHAAIGLRQLAHLDAWVERRRAIHAHWLGEIEARWGEHFQLQHALPDHQASPFGLSLLVRPESPLDPAALQAALQADGVFTRPLIAGNFARQPVWPSLGGRSAGADGSSELPVADWAHHRGFMIGLHSDLSDASAEFLIARLSERMRQL